MNNLIEEIPKLRTLQRFSPSFKTWNKNAERFLGKIFGPDSIHVKQFNEIRYNLSMATNFTPSSDYDNAFKKGLAEAEQLLKAFTMELDSKEEVKPVKDTKKPLSKKDVFLVHGHDEQMLLVVKDFVTSLGLNPIILHEKPDEGYTVIEKFEKHSNVSFAIILLSPDDVGYPINKEGEKRPRARQNVILEMGYYLAKLGRKGVRSLYIDGVEIPSDYKGVLFIKFEGDDWKLKLAKEMKVSGLDLDLNKLV